MTQPRIVEDMLHVSRHMNSNLRDCVSQHPEDFAKVHIDLNVLDEWVGYLKENKKIEAVDVLQEATWDLFSSIYSAANGLYRTAFMSIRSALELGISFLYFYDHNYNFLLWKKDMFDVKWANLNDPTGNDKRDAIISPYYLQFFCPELDDKKQLFCDNIVSLYRKTSQYVHGKYNYMHTVDGTQITFNSNKYDEWRFTFNEVVKALVLLLIIRFKIPRDFQPESIDQIKEMTKEFDEVWRHE
ncbi:hypothetical protein [Paenibacillus jiagnxiensis]|uniref:hypothetical protein n=1 Tax=Paenibacillus jiagnxiensis TaxID=3228926 RepID=UPI0033B98D4B